jgi:hypothetical protein
MMAAINEGWAFTQAEMAEAFRAGGAHRALAVGEAFAASLQPVHIEGFRLRDVAFRNLQSHRRNHAIDLDGHLAWAASAEWDTDHPLLTVLRLRVDSGAAGSAEQKARLMAKEAKILFSMGWVAEADAHYHAALLLDECPAARVGRAAVLRHRMYQAPKGLVRTGLWVEAMELVQEALDLEESVPARELMNGLKADQRWL